MKKQVFLNDKKDVILLYEVLRNSRCKTELVLLNDCELIAKYDSKSEAHFIDALTMYSLTALADEVIFEMCPDIFEEDFIEISAAIVYDEELNEITNEFLTDYFKDHTIQKSEEIAEVKLKLHGFRQFNMHGLVPLLQDYAKDYLENGGAGRGAYFGEDRFLDEELKTITIEIEEFELFVKKENGEKVLVDDILMSKQIFMDIEELIETSENPMMEANALSITALVLVSGTEVLRYEAKDEAFVMRLVELFHENKLTVQLEEIGETK